MTGRNETTMAGTDDGNDAASAKSSLGADDIKRVLDALDASDWDEALITVGDVSIAVARNGGTLPTAGASPTPAAPTSAPPAPAAAPAPVTAAPAPVTPEPAPTDGLVVTAPSVGVFWRAPEPGAPAFVEVGQHVDAGATLCIVEVMKLMSHVDAPVAGTVTAIHADNAASVEHGAPLFTLVPDEG
jgi:acetyl-CoA carboxylase biotin carboxyl carrier protein